MIQVTDAPAACMVAVGTYWPGTTWSKVKVRMLGSSTGCSAENETHDDVPRHTYAPSSGATTPAPTAAIGPSRPPG